MARCTSTNQACFMRTFKRLIMNFTEICNLSPINRQAARIVSQRGISEDSPLSRADLVALSNRLLRKQRLLLFVLGIRNDSQRRNVHEKLKRGIPTNRGLSNPRAMDEYKRIGPATQIIQVELSRLNAERKRLHLDRQKHQQPSPLSRAF